MYMMKGAMVTSRLSVNSAVIKVFSKKLLEKLVTCLLTPQLLFTGKCNSSSAAGETSPPAGFVYNAPADKYYSWIYQTLSWYDAQVQCSAQEATLIEGTTADEHEVMNIMRSKIVAT